MISCQRRRNTWALPLVQQHGPEPAAEAPVPLIAEVGQLLQQGDENFLNQVGRVLEAKAGWKKEQRVCEEWNGGNGAAADKVRPARPSRSRAEKNPNGA